MNAIGTRHVGQAKAGGETLAMDGFRSGIHERLSAARARMAATGVGCLIVYGRGVVGGYGNFTALSGLFPNVKGQYLLVPAEGPLILACGSSEEAEVARRYGPTELEVLCPDEPQLLPSFIGTSASRLSREVGSLRVGLAGSGKADAGWRDQAAITAQTGPLVDCTHIVEDVRVHPVEVDEDGVREIVHVLEDGLDAVTTLARPGMSEWEVSGIVEQEIRKEGILTSLVFVSAGPYWGQLPQGRPIRSDDVVTVIVEAASRHGYWAEIGTIFVGPSVRGEIVDRLQSWIQVAKECEGLVSAGAPAGRVATTLIERLSTVSQVDPSGLGHGVGVDEGPPAIRLGSEATLRAGSAIALHPSLTTADRSVRVSIANTVHITDDGASPISTAAHSIRTFS